MKNREWHNIVDKSEMGAGPWQDEPDKIQWTDEATGMPCLIVRNRMGALCGYAGVSQQHAFFGKDCGADELAGISVHGGLTFADFCSPINKEHGICHIVEPGEDDKVWWLGFDCGHYQDYIPRMHRREERLGVVPQDLVYRDIDYVKGEVASLAKQLKEHDD